MRTNITIRARLLFLFRTDIERPLETRLEREVLMEVTIDMSSLATLSMQAESEKWPGQPFAVTCQSVDMIC
eukprot:4309250-Amphidinium_carterae.2